MHEAADGAERTGDKLYLQKCNRMAIRQKNGTLGCRAVGKKTGVDARIGRL